MPFSISECVNMDRYTKEIFEQKEHYLIKDNAILSNYNLPENEKVELIKLSVNFDNKFEMTMYATLDEYEKVKKYGKELLENLL